MTGDFSGRDFGRLEGKLDSVLYQSEQNGEQLDELRMLHDALKERVDKWEQRAVGALAVAGLVGSLLTTVVGWVLGWFSHS